MSVEELPEPLLGPREIADALADVLDEDSCEDIANQAPEDVLGVVYGYLSSHPSHSTNEQVDDLLVERGIIEAAETPETPET